MPVSGAGLKANIINGLTAPGGQTPAERFAQRASTCAPPIRGPTGRLFSCSRAQRRVRLDATFSLEGTCGKRRSSARPTHSGAL